MANIRELVESSKQLQEAVNQIRQVPSMNEHKKFTAQTALAQTAAMKELQLRLSEIGNLHSMTKPIALSLAVPAFDVGRFTAAALTATSLNNNYHSIIGKAASQWHDMFKQVGTEFSRIQFPVQNHFAKLYEIAALSEASLSSLRLSDIGSCLRLDSSARLRLAETHTRMSEQYRSYFEEYTERQSAIVEVAPELTQLPAVEYLNQTALVVSTSVEEKEPELQKAREAVQSQYATETQDQLLDLLGNLDPKLQPLLIGARTVIETQHEDYVRHFAVSLRELFTHVLHTLAPDEKIKEWSSDPKDFDSKTMRPTRRARLKYITSGLSDSFGGFLQADEAAAVEFLDSFQKGTHVLNPGFKHSEVIALKVRMEGLIRLMIIAHIYK